MLRQHIVAIGGSAGSLEAILEIFDHTPVRSRNRWNEGHTKVDYIASPQDIPSIVRTLADRPQRSAISTT